MGEYWHSILVASGYLIVDGDCFLMTRIMVMMHKMHLSCFLPVNHSCPSRAV